MNDINNLFEKHIGKTEPLEIDGCKLQLVTLGTEYISDLLRLQAVFGKLFGEHDSKLDLTKLTPDQEIEQGKKFIKSLESLNEDNFKVMSNLVNATLKDSYPDMDDDKLSKIGSKFLMRILMHISKINSHTSADAKKADRVKKLMKDRLNDKSNKA